MWEPRQGVGCILGTVNLPNGMPRLGTCCQTLRNTKKTKKNSVLHHKTCGNYQKTSGLVPRNPATCTKTIPVCTKKKGTHLAGMDPNKTNMH